jgi:hypothetical protein|tara:strand:+ start:2252 stop:2470 length:219 start_codon:yes stop_codon:yes gene_type:complete
MRKKDILAKLKIIPDDIKTINDIVNYIFDDEIEKEKITYSSFRSIKLKEMVNDNLTYKEKLAIISVEWKKTK